MCQKKKLAKPLHYFEVDEFWKKGHARQSRWKGARDCKGMVAWFDEACIYIYAWPIERARELANSRVAFICSGFGGC
jgi:hypothetical protein